jgi:hypothetical protein
MLEWNVFGRGFDSRRLHHFMVKNNKRLQKDGNHADSCFSFCGKFGVKFSNVPSFPVFLFLVVLARQPIDLFHEPQAVIALIVFDVRVVYDQYVNFSPSSPSPRPHPPDSLVFCQGFSTRGLFVFYSRIFNAFYHALHHKSEAVVT